MWASPGNVFQISRVFFSGYGVYIAKHTRPEAATMRKGLHGNGWRIILGFFSAFWDFFLDSVLRGVLFACSMAPTGVFLGFHSFSRVLNVFWVFSLLFTGFFGFERFCFVLAVFGRVSRDLHTSDH